MPLSLHVPSPLPWFRARLRRGAAIAIAASTVFGTHHASALAQDAPPEDGDEPIELVGWDLADPVNHADSREFFAGLWAAEDAGLPPPEFEFTNTPPGLMLAMLLPELEVFTEIYGHRLQLDFDAGERYLVTDLIADDAEVRAEFRAFVLTGKLAPRPEIDAAAYLTHYQLVLDAVTVQQRASVVSVESLGMLLESEGLSVEATGPMVDEEPSPVQPESLDSENVLRCALQFLTKRSLLAADCFRKRRNQGGLYEQTANGPQPDFDCDDFSDALIRFLEKKLPSDWGLYHGLVYLTCGDKKLGHAVVIVKQPNGRYRWINPFQHGSDQVSPKSFPTWEDALRDVVIRRYPNCNWHPKLTKLVVPTVRGIQDEVKGEQPPWFTDPMRRRRFCEQLAKCCVKRVGLGGCTLPNWIDSAEVADCNADDYLPSLEDWQPDWGERTPCVVPAR